MAYTPREIKDRVAVGDDIFIVEDLGDNRIRLIPAPTHVSEAGTPVNKALLQPIEDYLATGVVPVERTITAGNGLTGGGSLTTNRTLSLGTPSTLSGATSNNVTSTSHTHAISVATQAEAEAGTDNVKLMTPLRVANALSPIRDELGNLSATKVDKVPGKGLSTNDFTNALKNKLDGIEAGAQVNTVTSVAGKTGAVTLSKSDVGLGSVQNYGIATQAQAQAGTVNNVYMTPLRVAQAIQSLGTKIAYGSFSGLSRDERIDVTTGFDTYAVFVKEGGTRDYLAVRGKRWNRDWNSYLSCSSTGFTAYRGSEANEFEFSSTCYWVAIGE